MERVQNFFRELGLFKVDWLLVIPVFILVSLGLVTMSSFTEGGGQFFYRQLIWFLIAIIATIVFSSIDWRAVKKTHLIFIAYIATIVGLLSLFILGQVSSGAQSWFRVGVFSIQPSDPAKIVLILVLAKYFSKRHIEIKQFRHILVSGIYSFVLFLLIFLQPDFGSAIIIFFIWFGMILLSGISKKHLLLVVLTGILAFSVLWFFVFAPYQKDRISTFLDPLSDPSGAGYNAFQSMIAVGSGGFFGKSVGYGTQSRLQFLPEYETDFIFAAFAEEWGLVGALIILLLFALIVWRLVHFSMHANSNFEALFGLGLAVLLMSQFTVHVGMNIGLLPITGTTLPFVSYGGSHLVTEFAALGIILGMSRYKSVVKKHDIHNEFIGPK